MRSSDSRQKIYPKKVKVRHNLTSYLISHSAVMKVCVSQVLFTLFSFCTNVKQTIDFNRKFNWLNIPGTYSISQKLGQMKSIHSKCLIFV